MSLLLWSIWEPVLLASEPPKSKEAAQWDKQGRRK